MQVCNYHFQHQKLTESPYAALTCFPTSTMPHLTDSAKSPKSPQALSPKSQMSICAKSLQCALKSPSQHPPPQTQIVFDSCSVLALAAPPAPVCMRPAPRRPAVPPALRGRAQLRHAAQERLLQRLGAGGVACLGLGADGERKMGLQVGVRLSRTQVDACHTM